MSHVICNLRQNGKIIIYVKISAEKNPAQSNLKIYTETYASHFFTNAFDTLLQYSTSLIYI